MVKIPDPLPPLLPSSSSIQAGFRNLTFNYQENIPLVPDHIEALKKADPNMITSEYYLQCGYDYYEYLLACNIPANQIVHPDIYFRGQEDLDLYINVVNWWPKAMGQAPNLYLLLSPMRITSFDSSIPTFRDTLNHHKQNAIRWCKANKVDPENPNESADEKRRRKNREKISAWRDRKKIEKSEDPHITKLNAAIAEAKSNLEQGKRWFRMKSTESSIARDNAIAAARAAHESSVLAFKEHVDLAEKQYREALLAREQYIANKQ